MNSIDLVHTDICPENIMIIENNVGLTGSASKDNPLIYIKIIGLNKTRELKAPDESDSSDSGSGESEEDEKAEVRIVGSGVSGNYFYTSPEMIATQEFTKKSDVFSIGVLIFWLLTGTYPYEPITEKGKKKMFD